MKTCITARIEQQRKSIRRTQINHFFLAKREIMLGLNRGDAIHLLMTHLDSLRNFLIYEENVHEASQSLHRIQQILNSYGSLEELVKPVEFSPSKLVEMKFGEAYRQMTWLDVFIHLLRYFKEEERIAEQCSSILSRCASEFNGKMTNMTRKGCFQAATNFDRQFVRLFESYPYELLLDKNCHLVENSLCFVTEVSLACKNGAAIYYMVNRASPGIIVLLNSLMENQQLFSIHSVNQEVYRAAVTLIYFITRYNYVKFNEREFNFLVSRVKANMLDGLTHSQTQEQFLQECWQLKLLFESTAVTLDRHEFELLEDMLAREIRNKHFKYLHMMQAILCHTTLAFRVHSVKLILGTLFDESEEVEDMKLKCCLVSLYSNQIINQGNRFRPEEAEMFISFWGEYTKIDRLLRLLARLERFGDGEKGLKGMFQLLTTLLGGPNLDYLTQMIDLVEEEYDQLYAYDHFKTEIDPSELEVI